MCNSLKYQLEKVKVESAKHQYNFANFRIAAKYNNNRDKIKQYG